MGETMNGSAAVLRSDPRLRYSLRMLHKGWAFVALTLVGVLCPTALAGAAQPALVVTPTPASGPALSYFKLSVGHGHLAQAGTIGLRNPSNKRLGVVLAPVAGQTINTLGSTYGVAGSRVRGPASWLRVGQRSVTLAPGQTLTVRVSVAVPRTAQPGDYLAGISVEQLGQQAPSTSRRGVSVASVVRYAIGVETSLPGPRRPLIQFTGARLKREPSGLTFLLNARNRGNVILQNVQGSALITRGHRAVARARLGPGTFVTRTAIAYPILAPRERPREGTVYRVRATLRYAGRTARLDTLVRFGRAAALRQQEYGGRKVSSSGLSGWLVALMSVIGGTLLCLAAAYLLRLGWGGIRSPVHVLEAALAASRQQAEPLGLIVVDIAAGSRSSRKLAVVLRSRLRHADRLCRVGAQRFVVVAPDTDLQAAEALAADLRRHAQRTEGASGVGISVLPEADDRESGTELLQRVRSTKRYAHTPVPAS
jgi:hypothetical protein